MKKKDVELGGIYTTKMSGMVVPVRILRQGPECGWVGRNLSNGREVRIRIAQRLRGRAEAFGQGLLRIAR